MSERRQVLLRIDPAVHDALMRWANDDLRSVNAQIEMLLRRALSDAGRMPKQAAPLPKRGRPHGRRRTERRRTDVEPEGTAPAGPPATAGPADASAPGQRQAGAPRRAPA